MSSDAGNILSSLPIDQIADRLGLPTERVTPAISEAVEALLSGMKANAADEQGAASLAKALPDHVATRSDLADVDEEDGKAIVANIFGHNTDSVITTLGEQSTTADPSLMSKLLPLVSPLVMSFLAKQVLGKGTTSRGSEINGGGIGDILGNVLRQGSNKSGGIGDLLGGLLGGGNSTGGGLGDLLGNLLGGGKR